MSPKAKQDLVISIVIYVVAGALFAVTGSMLPDSAMFPRMILILIVFINTLNMVSILRRDRALLAKGEREPSMLPFQTAKMPLVVFLGTAAYIVLFAFTNYFISTAVMLIAFMLIEKIKPKWMILVITGVYLAFIYYLFVVQLSVRLIR